MCRALRAKSSEKWQKVLVLLCLKRTGEVHPAFTALLPLVLGMEN